MRDIFVFGSNREGRHGAGAALHAVRHHGAIYGVSSGIQGDSYAILTKELRKFKDPVSLSEIEDEINRFMTFVRTHPDCRFLVTRVGCGLAGHSWDIIRPMFGYIPPSNVVFIDGRCPCGNS